MKAVGNLFDKCFSIENLYDAYKATRKSKRTKRACFEFEKSLGINILKLHEEIHTGTYKPKPYHSFIINEVKPRLIEAPAFRDTIVQHAIYKIVYPIFNNRFIDTSFACRKGKGTHACADYVQNAMRKSSKDSYNIHFDIKKFFYSIDRNILQKLIRTVIKDNKLLEIMFMYTVRNEPSGIPIGNLLSQLYALLYLNPIDHFIKRELKIKYYARYVDDLVLIGLNKEYIKECCIKIENYLSDNLNLVLSKMNIIAMKNGINFVGYRTWRSGRFVRKHSIYKFNKALNIGIINTINSLMAHARNTGTHINYCFKILTQKPNIISMLPHYSNRTYKCNI